MQKKAARSRTNEADTAEDDDEDVVEVEEEEEEEVVTLSFMPWSQCPAVPQAK